MWYTMNGEETMFEGRLVQALNHRTAKTTAEWEARPAAVLIPLYESDGRWHVLFTQRTDSVPDHRGQVSFPGGRVDPDDPDRETTALRETEEEIGLPKESVRVLGTLNELITVTQWRITPVVGVIPWPFPVRLSREEVSAVFGVPLVWLADPANLEIQYRKPPVPGPEVPVYYYHFGERTIWGATARILQDLFAVLREAGVPLG